MKYPTWGTYRRGALFLHAERSPRLDTFTGESSSPTLRWVPAWVWRAFALLLWLGILYSLGSWLWSYLSG
jgi:hypothetical protein